MCSRVGRRAKILKGSFSQADSCVCHKKKPIWVDFTLSVICVAMQKWDFVISKIALKTDKFNTTETSTDGPNEL